MKTYEQLKPQCADAGASYEERKAKRDAEIKSLEQVGSELLGAGGSCWLGCGGCGGMVGAGVGAGWWGGG